MMMLEDPLQATTMLLRLSQPMKLNLGLFFLCWDSHSKLEVNPTSARYQCCKAFTVCMCTTSLHIADVHGKSEGDSNTGVAMRVELADHTQGTAILQERQHSLAVVCLIGSTDAGF